MTFKLSRSTKLSLGDGVQGSGCQRSVDDARWKTCAKRNAQCHKYFIPLKEILQFESVTLSNSSTMSRTSIRTSLTAISMHCSDSISLRPFPTLVRRRVTPPHVTPDYPNTWHFKLPVVHFAVKKSKKMNQATVHSLS